MRPFPTPPVAWPTWDDSAIWGATVFRRFAYQVSEWQEWRDFELMRTLTRELDASLRRHCQAWGMIGCFPYLPSYAELTWV